MRHILLIVLLFAMSAGMPAAAQDYQPSKESVPAINRYEARLQLTKALNQCSDKFYFIWKGNYSKLTPVAPPLIDNSKIVITYRFGDEIKPFEPCIYEFAKIEVPYVEFSKRQRYNTYLLKTEGLGKNKNLERDWILDAGQELCKQIADALFILKWKSQPSQDSADNVELESFKQIATKYRSLVSIPPLNEDARRYLVQATTATEEKRYDDGIDLLAKALKVDPAYPQAHFNRALLWAQVSIYGAAIVEMKKYLMLAPNADDAGASQDKIYEWEGKMDK